MSKLIPPTAIGFILVGIGVFLATHSYDIATHGVDIGYAGNWSDTSWAMTQATINHVGEIIVAAGCGILLLAVNSWIKTAHQP